MTDSRNRFGLVAAVAALLCGESSLADDANQRLLDAGREQFTRVRQLDPMQRGATQVDRYFNAQSCAECHKLGGVGGAGPNENNVQLVDPSAILRSSSRITLEEFRAPRERTISCFVESSESNLRPRRLEFAGRGTAVDEWKASLDQFHQLGADGIYMLHRRSTEPGYDAIRAATLTRRNGEDIEERNTPPLFGLGLIASISQDDLDAIAAAQPAALRGRSPRLKTGGRGRFGWKSQNATLAGFNEGACAAELGLRTAKFTPSERTKFHGRAPGVGPMTLPRAPEVDMTVDDLTALTAFVASLPMPRQVFDVGRERDVAAGAEAFRSIGCAVCHVPDVGSASGLYSDLLLHNIGTSGAAVYYDSGDPAAQEFDIVRSWEIRTPPLWGIADSAPYLHDGSAKDLEAAIRAHKEQAESSVRHYDATLDSTERAQLLAFLRSLRAPQVAAQNRRMTIQPE